MQTKLVSAQHKLVILESGRSLDTYIVNRVWPPLAEPGLMLLPRSFVQAPLSFVV